MRVLVEMVRIVQAADINGKLDDPSGGLRPSVNQPRIFTITNDDFETAERAAFWHYYFRVRGVRYRGVIPEARTKWEAEQAETKIKREIFEGRFGQLDLGSEKLADFIEKVFVPWSKANKRSWRHDEFRALTIREYFLAAKPFASLRRCWLRNSNVTDANRSRRGRRFVVSPQSISSLIY